MEKLSRTITTEQSRIDFNYYSAIVSTVACCVLVVNAVLSFLPFLNNFFTLPSGVIYVEGVLSVFSCSFFLIGSSLAFFKTLRAKRRGNFEVEIQDLSQTAYDDGTGTGSSYWTSDTLQRTTTKESIWAIPADDADEAKSTKKRLPQWNITMTVHQVQSYYWMNLDCIANGIFLASSSVYACTAVLSLITILMSDAISTWIRYPQLVAGFGFAIASLLLMIRLQEKWWKPAFNDIMWHVNLLNLVGSAGFIFCSSFGLIENVYWARYQFGCSYLWVSQPFS